MKTELIKLSSRLQEIASFVPPGSAVADIGTDHGYIPVWLAQKGIANKITAADINQGPLDHARQTAETYGVSDQIQFRLCNGLDFPDSASHNTVIIAGMGGELIASILEAAPWTQNGSTLILQPNTRIQMLVAWLTEHNYTVLNTRLVKDAGKIYQILIVQAGESAPIPTEAEQLVHRMYFSNQDPLLPEYLEILLNRYRGARTGMLAGKTENPELNRVQQLIEALSDMKKETEKWQR